MASGGWLKSLGLGESDRGREEVRQIPVDSIRPGSHQYRTRFSEPPLAELADSIAEHGVIHPIILRPTPSGYELVAGERRWRAAKLVGLKTIPAIVRDMSEQDVALVGLIENLHREGLNPIDEASGYLELLTQFQLTQEQVAKRVGRSQPAVANKLRLLKLPEDVREALASGTISERHARALLRLQHAEDQSRILGEILQNDLTVKETEDLVDGLVGRTKPGSAEEIAAAGETRVVKRQRVVKVVRDIRIFLNSFREAVRLLRQSGVATEMDERDEGDQIVLEVRIAKRRPGGGN